MGFVLLNDKPDVYASRPVTLAFASFLRQRKKLSDSCGPLRISESHGSPVGQHGLRCTISSVIYTQIVRSFIHSFITEIYIAPFKVNTQKRSRHLHG